MVAGVSETPRPPATSAAVSDARRSDSVRRGTQTKPRPVTVSTAERTVRPAQLSEGERSCRPPIHCAVQSEGDIWPVTKLAEAQAPPLPTTRRSKLDHPLWLALELLHA